jgi:hypothetical protein
MSGMHAGPSVPTPPAPPGEEPPRPRPPELDERPGGEPPDGRGPGAVPWGVALIAAGVLWLLSLAGVSLPWEALLPAALVMIGVAVIVWPRSAGSGLLGLGVVLLVVTLFVAILPGSTSVSAGDRTFTVTDPAGLDDAYELGAGNLVLDLGALELSEAAEVTARVGMGELVVVVPEGLRLDGRARVGLGEVEVFGDATGGVAPTVDLGSVGPETDRSVLTLDLQVGMGQIEVRR